MNASQRRYFYALAAAAVAVAAAYGLIAEEIAPLWLALIGAVLWALGNIQAIIKTDSTGRSALYGVSLAVVALLVGYNILSEDQAPIWVAVLGALFGVGTNVLAAVNTTPAPASVEQ